MRGLMNDVLANIKIQVGEEFQATLLLRFPLKESRKSKLKKTTETETKKIPCKHQDCRTPTPFLGQHSPRRASSNRAYGVGSDTILF